MSTESGIVGQLADLPCGGAALPAAVMLLVALGLQAGTSSAGEALRQFRQRLADEHRAAYEASPFSKISKDYFARFSRDPDAAGRADEVSIDPSWKILLPENLSPVGVRMAEHLSDFLTRCMKVRLTRQQRSRKDLAEGAARAIVLLDCGGGEENAPESFTITVARDRLLVAGRDPQGLRDGVVRLVDLMGFRQAPILAPMSQTFKPGLAVRLGAVPWLGSHKDAVFMGYNAVFVPGGELFALSASDAIGDLARRREPDRLKALARGAREARRYGLRCYAILSTRKKFPQDHPVFARHPEIRGSRTWGAHGEYVLCTEHPLARRYLRESVAGLFRAAPELDGIVIIIGGEGFYHCFMRAHGKCPRCAKLGAETVVANLCNALAQAARQVKPTAEVVAWPYSAQVWSADHNQEGFIGKLKAGTAILTEVEKDETVQKPDGVSKRLWDYSIDMTGLGSRARAQLAACRKVKIPIYFKSEPEQSFEAPRLPGIPCLDRWAARAEALAASGAKGSFVFPGTGHPVYGMASAEVYKYFSWSPAPKPEDLLGRLAARIAGRKAGPHLRKAWKAVSEAIAFSPELPPYYVGPYYFGPGHPMCANPSARLPRVFYGKHLYRAEAVDAEGLRDRPGFLVRPRGNAAVFGKFYRQMEKHLRQAVEEVQAAEPLVPDRCRLMFASEGSAIRWFYHTARSHANFYASCQCRDQWSALTAKPKAADLEKARKLHARWKAILEDEKANAEAALPVMKADVRLDYYYGGDHCYHHGAQVIAAKLKLIEQEISSYLPSLRARYEAALKK